MRTTVDLPDDLHSAARSLARDRGLTFSATVVELLRRGLGEGVEPVLSLSPTTGLTTVRLGRTVTVDDVRALDDE